MGTVTVSAVAPPKLPNLLVLTIPRTGPRAPPGPIQVAVTGSVAAKYRPCTTAWLPALPVAGATAIKGTTLMVVPADRPLERPSAITLCTPATVCGTRCSPGPNGTRRLRRDRRCPARGPGRHEV